LFKDIGNRNAFSLNIYRGSARNINFSAIFNLFLPATIESSRGWSRPIPMPVPGIKNDDNEWETGGHPDRIITVTEEDLARLARLFEAAGTPPAEARLPQIHGRPILSVLEKIGRADIRLDSFKDQYHPTVMFDETYAQRDGIITRVERPTYQAKSVEEIVLTGPLFQIATPWAKSPNTVCTTQRAYSDIDLTELSEDYLPKVVYRPGNAAGDLAAFREAIDEWPRPTLPGFWPVPKDERPIWEAICGEELILHSVDRSSPGASTARRFAYFEQADESVLDSIKWITRTKLAPHTDEYLKRFPNARLVQALPSKAELAKIPRPLTSYFRHVHRKRGQPANVRTFMPTIVPPGPTHVLTVFSITFLSEKHLLRFTGSGFSIVYDFLLRMSGKEDFLHEQIKMLPILMGSEADAIAARTLRLVSLTRHYAPLWERNFADAMQDDAWTVEEARLIQEHELTWSDLQGSWAYGCALRSDFARRQALLEIDVLVAQALNLTLDELQTIYRVQFPVMRQYENADEYDAKGRRLPNTVRKDPGAKELREARKSHDGALPLTVSWRVDNGLATVTKTFHPPFTGVDREGDYRRAWAAFIVRFNAD
jgi:hypothetical protein